MAPFQALINTLNSPCWFATPLTRPEVVRDSDEGRPDEGNVYDVTFVAVSCSEGDCPFVVLMAIVPDHTGGDGGAVTVNVKVLLAIALAAAPVATTVNEPDAFAVPLSSPPDVILSPTGRVDPEATAKLVAFEAANCTEYAVPAMTVESVVPVVHTGRSTTVCVKMRSAKTTLDVVDSARTVKVKDPADVGVPANTPAVLSVTPTGKEPPVSAKPVGLTLVATSVVVYATCVDTLASALAVDHVGVVATIWVKARSAVAFVAFAVALSVNEYDPAVGVPVSSPPLDKDSPEGRAPEKTAYDSAFVAVY